MAEYISFQPKDFFNSILYTGTSSSNAVTGNGFLPALVWLKDRDQTYYNTLFDSVRGTTKLVYTNASNAEETDVNSVTAFGADGFTVGSSNNVNYSGDDFASWNWKAGTTTGIATNGSTTITPSSYSFNQTSGFSILKYTGNNTAGAKLAHGLGAVPSVIFVKNLDSANDWYVYHRSLDSSPEDYYLVLNTTGAKVDSNGAWYDTAPDSVNITLGNNANVNNTDDFVAYCFADKSGYSRFNMYTGNGNVNGAYIYTGFSTKFLVIKSIASGQSWIMKTPITDTPPYNPSTRFLVADTTVASGTGALIDFTAEGFKLRNTWSSLNTSGQKYVYFAWAEFPIVASNKTPGVAR